MSETVICGGDNSAISGGAAATDTYEFAHIFIFQSNTACGWPCADQPDNQLAIGANGETFDATSRDAAGETCGPVCSASAECGGFNYLEADSRCYYRRETSCDFAIQTNRDCFTKIRTTTTTTLSTTTTLLPWCQDASGQVGVWHVQLEGLITGTSG